MQLPDFLKLQAELDAVNLFDANNVNPAFKVGAKVRAKHVRMATVERLGHYDWGCHPLV